MEWHCEGMSGTPFHCLISFAYLRKKAFCDLAQLAEISHFFIDSGAFTNHVAGLKAASKGVEAEGQITLDEYCQFLRQFGSNLYGAIALDRIGDERTSHDNLMTMVDRGLRPVPVLTVNDDVERVNEYRLINQRICVPTGYGSTYTEAFRKNRIRSVHGAATGPVFLHGLAYTRYPDMMQVPLHSADSSTFTAGKRFGKMDMFNLQKVSQIHQKKAIKMQEEFNTYPLNVDWGRLAKKEKGYATGGSSVLAAVGSIDHANIARIVWSTGKRYFMACSIEHDLRNALVAWYITEVETKPLTLDDYKGLWKDVISPKGIIPDWIAQPMRARKNEGTYTAN